MNVFCYIFQCGFIQFILSYVFYQKFTEEKNGLLKETKILQKEEIVFSKEYAKFYSFRNIWRSNENIFMHRKKE